MAFIWDCWRDELCGFVADICFDFDELEIEEEDEDEELKGDYFCPLCSEDFDLVGLCCHVEEEHPVEAKSGVLVLLFFFFFVIEVLG